MCYGRNLATMDMVDLGEAVGILAAQSIGEPGTQLTLRTFHIGGTAARIAEQTVRKTKVEGVIEYGDRLTFVQPPEGQRIVTSYEGELMLKAAAHGGPTASGKLAVHSRFHVPLGATLMVEDGQKVGRDGVLFTWDPYTNPILTDVPGVIELFEARRPKDPATISEMDGTVRFGDIKRGKREIWIHPEEGEDQLYEVQASKHLRVHEGDRVRAGDRLTEGPVNPHDILRIKGPRAVQEYLVNEIQEVYRLQGVKINDKHIGVIVRQMLQKVKVVDPGDTDFLEGENVDKNVFRDVNDRAIKKGGKPATSEHLLLGITKASLTTQSFISAASFQETTRVLTDAAIRGARDDLLGLKENIIIGHLIPAGTGIYRYQEVEVEPPPGFEPPPPPVEAVPGAAPSPFVEEVQAE